MKVEIYLQTFEGHLPEHPKLLGAWQLPEVPRVGELVQVDGVDQVYKITKATWVLKNNDCKVRLLVQAV